MHGPHEPHEPTVSDDATHLSTIALSAIAAVVVTAGLVSLGAHAGPVHEVDEIPLAFTVETTVVHEVDVDAGADRLYGRVLTKSGDELQGYLRWQGREASWSDVLRTTRPGGSALAGVRFGNVARIEPRGARDLDLTLKSGEVVRLNAIAQRAGAALRPMSIESEGMLAEVPMHDLESVDFLPEPLDLKPIAERIFGTLITRSGLGFTGYIAWDLAELDASALLEGVQGAIPFAEIASIARLGDGGCWWLDAMPPRTGCPGRPNSPSRIGASWCPTPCSVPWRCRGVSSKNFACIQPRRLPGMNTSTEADPSAVRS